MSEKILKISHREVLPRFDDIDGWGQKGGAKSSNYGRSKMARCTILHTIGNQCVFGSIINNSFTNVDNTISCNIGHCSWRKMSSKLTNLVTKLNHFILGWFEIGLKFFFVRSKIRSQIKDNKHSRKNLQKT